MRPSAKAKAGGLPDALNQRDEALSLALELRELASEIERVAGPAQRSGGMFVGVHRDKGGRWVASITVKRVRHSLGMFDTAEEAARARDESALRLIGPSVRLNFPAEPEVPPGARAVHLTRGGWALVDEQDYERVSQWRWQFANDQRGRARYAHRYQAEEGGAVSMHRYILGITDRRIQVDHVNRNGLDNRRSNLRVCSQSQNMANMGLPSSNKSGLKGVSWYPRHGKWRASIHSGRHRWLGTFADKFDAARAYDKAAVELFGEFARTNESMGLLPKESHCEPHQLVPGASMIAALFVAKNGAYWNLPNVDPWDEARDARKYAGPWPVVAHPPCNVWCQYARLNYSRYGGEHNRPGNDGGCFASALAAVRTWGGVLEHPAHSLAWPAFGLIAPPRTGGWVVADSCGARTCHVEQCHYGHRAHKATWLYVLGTELPDLRWGDGKAEAWCSPGASAKASRGKAHKTMSKRERQATPPAFRDLLISIARTAPMEAETRAKLAARPRDGAPRATP